MDVGMPPDDIEKLRALAKTMLAERYGGNQSAFARDLGIRSTNIKRFVVDEAGGISRQTAEKLSALSRSKPSGPPPSTRKPPLTKDTELEKCLDFFSDRWETVTGDVARSMVKHLGLTRNRSEWIEVLDEIETAIEELIKKYK